MTDNNQPAEKHLSKADKAQKAAQDIFLSFDMGILPAVIPAAIELRGLSIQRPQVYGKLSEFFNKDPQPNEPWLDLRIQLSIIQRPNRLKLADLYQAEAEELASDMEEKYSEGHFGDALIILDKTVTMELELDEKNAKLVGAQNVTLTITVTEDVTGIVPDGLVVDQ